MVRDKIKPQEYFDSYIQNTQKRKSKYIEKIEGLDDPHQGYINSAITLDLFTRNLFIAKYSEGYEVSQLRHDYVKSIKLFELTYNSTSFYVQMLWMISIGIMLDIEADEFSKLIELIKKDDPNDYLIDFLLCKKVNWDKQAKNFKFPDPYQSLEQVISLATSGEKEKAVEKLKLYLDKEWYKGHSDTGWYDNHKSKHDTYAGYWSWESGALVQVLGLDDSSLKDQQYYPYDMVHWND